MAGQITVVADFHSASPCKVMGRVALSAGLGLVVVFQKNGVSPEPEEAGDGSFGANPVMA